MESSAGQLAGSAEAAQAVAPDPLAAVVAEDPSVVTVAMVAPLLEAATAAE